MEVRPYLPMKKPPAIKAIFTDIGGVLLTNGWDHDARRLAAKTFALNHEELETRHHTVFDTYESGKMTLEDYLGHVVFYQRRRFTREQFRRFMFRQTKAFPAMITLLRHLKVRYGLKVFVVSNEGRELNAHRLGRFGLAQWVDCFVSSSFVHLRKPDAEIFRLALDLAQVPARQVVYIDDRAMFVEIAKSTGMRGFQHTDAASSAVKLAALGLRLK